MPPEAGPDGAEPGTAAEDPAPEEAIADEPPPATQAPRAQNSRVGPGGIAIPNIPGFSPRRKNDD